MLSFESAPTLGALRAQTSLDVAQTLSVGKLRERHAKKLVEARECLYFALPVVAFDNSSKRMQRKMVHQLREHQLAFVHDLASK